jgi:hypothetical protein
MYRFLNSFFPPSPSVDQEVDHKRTKNYNAATMPANGVQHGVAHFNKRRVVSSFSTVIGPEMPWWVHPNDYETFQEAHWNKRRVTGKTYDLWDSQKIQGCQCDANWEGPDCSLKTCPRGNDPLTTQTVRNYYSTLPMRQILQLGVDGGSGATAV